MIDGVLVNDIGAINAIVGITVAAVPLWFALRKLKNILYGFFVQPLVDRFNTFCQTRQDERIKQVFEEIQPMIEAHVHLTLQEHRQLLDDQQIILKSSIAENVEFKSFVNEGMITLTKSIDKLVLVVTKNTEDSKRVRDCLETIDGKTCPAFKIKQGG